MISFAVTAKLICVFVFAYADCWFSHEAAQMVMMMAEMFSKVINIACFGDLNLKFQFIWATLSVMSSYNFMLS